MSDLEAVDVLAALTTVREMLDELALDVPVAGTPTERYAVVEALGLRSELPRKALGVTADGEITATPVEVADRLWSVADIAVGRTKVLRALLDGDLDEYCEEEWKPNMERRPA